MSDKQITEVVLRLAFEHHEAPVTVDKALQDSIAHADLLTTLAVRFPATLVEQRIVSISTQSVAAAAADAAEAQLVEQLLALPLDERGPLSGDGDLPELTARDLARVFATWWASWAPYTPEGLRSLLGVMDADRDNTEAYLSPWFAAVRRAIEQGTLA